MADNFKYDHESIFTERNMVNIFIFPMLRKRCQMKTLAKLLHWNKDFIRYMCFFTESATKDGHDGIWHRAKFRSPSLSIMWEPHIILWGRPVGHCKRHFLVTGRVLFYKTRLGIRRDDILQIWAVVSRMRAWEYWQGGKSTGKLSQSKMSNKRREQWDKVLANSADKGWKCTV